MPDMRDLFDDLERDARQRSEDLERDGRLPQGFTAKHYPMTPAEQRELRRLKTALTLADGADTFVALANQDRVPRGWLERRLKELGIRR